MLLSVIFCWVGVVFCLDFCPFFFSSLVPLLGVFTFKVKKKRKRKVEDINNGPRKHLELKTFSPKLCGIVTLEMNVQTLLLKTM